MRTLRVWNVMERKGEGGLPKNVGCRATTREMGVDWQGGEGRGRRLVSGLRGGSKMGMVVRERAMAETEVVELGVGIPKIKGCCQWLLISAMSMIGILKHLKRSLDLFSPAYVELPPPDPENKRLRMSHKVSEIIELKLLVFFFCFL
ncbi:unnamed protein product [Malus baccata var. baccata]